MRFSCLSAAQPTPSAGLNLNDTAERYRWPSNVYAVNSTFIDKMCSPGLEIVRGDAGKKIVETGARSAQTRGPQGPGIPGPRGPGHLSPGVLGSVLQVDTSYT